MTTDESPNVQECIDTVARMIAFRIFAPEAAAWEDYPDIGQEDWDRICDALDDMAPECPNIGDFRDAYECLSRRAIH